MLYLIRADVICNPRGRYIVFMVVLTDVSIIRADVIYNQRGRYLLPARTLLINRAAVSYDPHGR